MPLTSMYPLPRGQPKSGPGGTAVPPRLPCMQPWCAYFSVDEIGPCPLCISRRVAAGCFLTGACLSPRRRAPDPHRYPVGSYPVPFRWESPPAWPDAWREGSFDEIHQGQRRCRALPTAVPKPLLTVFLRVYSLKPGVCCRTPRLRRVPRRTQSPCRGTPALQ